MKQWKRRIANKFKLGDTHTSSVRPADPSDNAGRSSLSTTHLDGNHDGLFVASVVQSNASQYRGDFPPISSSSNEPVHNFGDSEKNLVRGRGWDDFKLALNATKEVASAFPPLQNAVGGLLKVLDTIQQVSDNEDQFTSMAERLMALSIALKKFEEHENDQAVRDRLEALTKSIERHVTFVEERMERGNLRRALDASKDARDIINSLRELTFAVHLFEIDTVMNTAVLGKKVARLVNDLREREILKVLNTAEGAAYNETGRSGCLDGTRIDTLSKILAWAFDSSSSSVYWLSGMAGTGKSTIAISICKLLDMQGRLGGSFFCSRQSESLNRIGRILPTISFQLSCISEVYRREVVHILEHTSRTSYATASLQEQMTALFIEPSKRLPSFSEETPIIVIDALDECSFESTVIDFLRVTLRSDLPFKFLISSRPETHIVGGFSSQRRFESDTVLNRIPGFRRHLIDYTSLRLHDVEADIVEDDITRYLKWKLAYVFNPKNDLSIQNDIGALAKKSGKLFIFAFTAVQYITVGANLNLSSKGLRLRLKRLIQSPGGPTHHQTEIIDNLYRHIFASAYSRKEAEEITFLRSVLDTALCIFEPQSVSSIATLLGEDPGDIRELLGNFHSVLAVPESDDTPVLMFHASFFDFVRAKSRSDEYSLNEKGEHQRLVLLCLRLMNHHLQKDICNIRIRQTRNSDIHPLAVQKHIPYGLRYACYFWASHLALIGEVCGDNTQITQELESFINSHLLHWLECLSITENLHRAVNCLQKARVHLSKLPMTDSIAILKSILAEAELLIPQCFQFMKIHALEIYSSALVWLPKQSKLCQQFTPNDGIPCLLHGLKENWEVCEQILQMDNFVSSLSFSPDESKLAVGLPDTTVRIWSLEAGEEVKKLEGHSSWVWSVLFSPDGSKLASGSEDRNLKLWNVESGEELRKLEHLDIVRSVSFSPDGTMLASGSDDKAVRVWNLESGEVSKKLEGHSDRVWSVSFSLDGSKLASGSSDGTVRIWKVESGVELKKLEGHSDWVRSVFFSPNGSKLASGSDDRTLRVWSMESGKELQKLEGHSDTVFSISFSPDGSQLASGSFDNTVRIWGLESGEELKKLEGHLNRVFSVSFSPDGTKLASGSDDKTVRIWKVLHGDGLKKLGGHSGMVRSVSFSPDGTILASGSSDSTVRIWKVESGQELKRLEGHLSWVQYVSFSPDGSKLASGSDDGTVRIWNVESGEVLKKLDVHLGMVRSVSFSPDGSKLASGSYDGTVRIWNVVSGVELKKLKGHSDLVWSVSFSPDGSKLASGSCDGTVRIWDVKSGEGLNWLGGHSDSVKSVSFSPDGSKLASGSDDKCVRIWNVVSGEMLNILTMEKFGLIYLADGSVLRISNVTSVVKFEHPASTPIASLVIDTVSQRGCIVFKTILIVALDTSQEQSS